MDAEFAIDAAHVVLGRAEGDDQRLGNFAVGQAGREQVQDFQPYFDALWKRGQLYAAQGDWENAMADYTAAIEADPRWPWVYYLRARALAELGRSDEAQADLARALELDPVDELRQQIESFDAELTD